jgi:hypothetical protein
MSKNLWFFVNPSFEYLSGVAVDVYIFDEHIYIFDEHINV